MVAPCGPDYARHGMGPGDANSQSVCVSQCRSSSLAWEEGSHVNTFYAVSACHGMLALDWQSVVGRYGYI